MLQSLPIFDWTSSWVSIAGVFSTLVVETGFFKDSIMTDSFALKAISPNFDRILAKTSDSWDKDWTF